MSTTKNVNRTAPPSPRQNILEPSRLSLSVPLPLHCVSASVPLTSPTEHPTSSRFHPPPHRPYRRLLKTFSDLRALPTSSPCAALPGYTRSARLCRPAARCKGRGGTLPLEAPAAWGCPPPSASAGSWRNRPRRAPHSAQRPSAAARSPSHTPTRPRTWGAAAVAARGRDTGGRGVVHACWPPRVHQARHLPTATPRCAVSSARARTRCSWGCRGRRAWARTYGEQVPAIHKYKSRRAHKKTAVSSRYISRGV